MSLFLKNGKGFTLEELDEVFTKTVDLIMLYQKYQLSIPFSLKGNIGEFITAKKLVNHFPGYKILFVGGASPGFDLKINDIKIQVKTQFKNKPRRYRGGEFDFESSPTISKDFKNKCDILILIVIYNLIDDIKNNDIKVYIFNESDFEYFDHRFCWSGKSNGDYTIVKVLNVTGDPPEKLKEIINFYGTQKYKELFENSLNAWDKIGSLL